MLRYVSYAHYYESILKEFAEKCTLCGVCMEGCLVPRSKDKSPVKIMENLMDYVKGKKDEGTVMEEVFGCAYCGHCSEACPEGLDQMLVHEAIKMRLAKAGIEPPAALQFMLPGKKSVHRVLADLQTVPSSRRWVYQVPVSVRGKAVLFLGCFLEAMPHVVLTTLDILDHIGAQYVVLSGGDLCCGTVYCPAGGMAGKAEEQGRKLHDVLVSAGAEDVIFFCTGCYRQFEEFYSKIFEIKFHPIFYSEYLSGLLAETKFPEVAHKVRVAFFESCMTRRTKVSQSARELLARLPGVELVEIPNAERLCCGGLAHMTAPSVARELLVQLGKSLASTGADQIVTCCPFCMLNLYPIQRAFGFRLGHIPGIISDRLRLRERRDILSLLWEKEPAEILEICKDNYTEAGWSEDEIRPFVSMLFGKMD